MLPESKLKEMLLQMHLIRAFEEKADELYALGKVHGTMHLSIGQEAMAVGAIAALHLEDYILSTHRGHGHCIAKGADIKLMMAEFMGKETGYCRGRGGSMHIADMESGNLGANGVVGGGIGMAVGAGMVTAGASACNTSLVLSGALVFLLGIAAMLSSPMILRKSRKKSDEKGVKEQ